MSPNEERERLFDEKMSQLSSFDLETIRRRGYQEAETRKHCGEISEEEDARLMVVGTRYYQDTREALSNFLEQVRGSRLIIKPEPDCQEDKKAIAVYQNSENGFRKIGYIAKEYEDVAKAVIDQSDGKQGIIFIEGAEKNHTSLKAWPVLNGVVTKTVKRMYRMPYPCGDIGAIWPLKVTDTALELAKFFTGNCTSYEKLFLTNLFCRAAANNRKFAPAAKYFTDDLRLSQDQSQKIAVATQVNIQTKYESGKNASEASRTDEGNNKEQQCIKASIEVAVNDKHFRAGKDWGLVKYALEELGKKFSSYNTFLQYLRSLGFDCLPAASTVSRGYSAVHGSSSRGYYFDHSDTVETIRKSNIMKIILGFYHKKLA